MVRARPLEAKQVEFHLSRPQLAIMHASRPPGISSLGVAELAKPFITSGHGVHGGETMFRKKRKPKKKPC